MNRCKYVQGGGVGGRVYRKTMTMSTYMRVGYPLDGEGGWQTVLNGPGGGRRVGPQDDGVRRTLKRREDAKKEKTMLNKRQK